jgi:hypothetical protein
MNVKEIGANGRVALAPPSPFTLRRSSVALKVLGRATSETNAVRRRHIDDGPEHLGYSIVFCAELK